MSLLEDYVGGNAGVAAVQAHLNGEESTLSMFKVDPVSLPGSLDIVHAEVKNNILVIAVANNKLLRIDLSNPAEIQDLEVPRFKNNESGTVCRVFLDDTGHHILATTDKGSNWYLHMKLTKPARLKTRGIVSSVAWNSSATPFATKEILMGLAGGTVIETWLEPIEGFNKSVERYAKQVHSMDTGDGISGLRMYPGPSPRDRNVLLSTSKSISHFRGSVGSTSDSSVLSTVFTADPGLQAFEVPLASATLELTKGLDDFARYSFAWLCSAGILYGPAPSSSPGNMSFENSQMLNFSAIAGDLSEALMVQSAYHIIILKDTRLSAFNRFNGKKVYEETLSSLDKLIGLVADPIQQTYWLFSRTELFEIVITDEGQQMWQIFLQKRDYDAALKYSSHEGQKLRIYAAQAEALMARQEYEDSASIFAKSDAPIEQVALKFLDLQQRDALRTYLLKKLAAIKKSDEIQRIMLATWVLELFLAKFTALDDLQNNLRDNDKQAGAEPLQKQYADFIVKHKADLDRQATYTLINSYGRKDELLLYSEAIKDHEYMVNYYIQQDNYTKALELLIKHPNVELTYSSSTILLSEAPKETVEMWMRLNSLDPSRLLPAILSYCSNRSMPAGDNQALRYLQFVVKHQDCTDRALHNALLGIYARDCGNDEKELLAYLDTQGKNANYDLDFALRQCKQHDRIQSCVHIYSNMGLFDQAVQWALQHDDIRLAGVIADRVEDNPALRKKLWMMVAKKTLRQPGGVKAAIEMSKQSQVLRIEDLVPHFEDFTVIDDFKDEICSALEGYSRNIEALRQEMDESSRTADTITQNIKDLKMRFAIIQVGEECYHCHRPLMDRQFYVFPCQHTFHSDCMTKLALKIVPGYQKRRIVQLQGQITRTSAAISQQQAASTDGSAAGSTSLRNQFDRLREELDDMVAGECMLCGSLMIRSIDEGFLAAADKSEAAEVASWEV